MNNDNNDIKIIIAIVGFILVIYFANVKIKNIKENKDKATIENATKILDEFNLFLGGFTDEQKKEFIVFAQTIGFNVEGKIITILRFTNALKIGEDYLLELLGSLNQSLYLTMNQYVKQIKE